MQSISVINKVCPELTFFTVIPIKLYILQQNLRVTRADLQGASKMMSSAYASAPKNQLPM